MSREAARPPLQGGDVVILVVGATGSGKSSFINDYLAAINHPALLDVGSDLSSKTSEIQAVIVEKHTCQFPPPLSWDTRLVLVDTPGFNRGSDVRADPNLMDDITTWFRDSKAALGGVIYLYSISEVLPSLDSAKGNVFLFNNKLGKDSCLRKTVMVISKWEGLEGPVFSRRFEEVQNKWRTITKPNGKAGTGAQIERWGFPTGGRGNAKDIIESCLPGVEPRLRVLSNELSSRRVPLPLTPDPPPGPATENNHRVDFVVLVTGETGVGKSYFINHLLHFIGDKRRLKVGRSLLSCTDKVTGVVMPDQTPTADNAAAGLDAWFPTNFACYNDRYRIVIVDTPGFNQLSLSDDEISKQTATWIQELPTEAVLGGVIYLADISLPRPPDLRKHLEALRRRCVRVTPNKVLVATTTPGVRVPSHEREAREQLLMRHLGLMKQKGTALVSLGSDNEERGAWEIILQVLQRFEEKPHPPAAKILALIVAGETETGKSAFIEALLREVPGRVEATPTGDKDPTPIVVDFTNLSFGPRDTRLFVFNTPLSPKSDHIKGVDPQVLGWLQERMQLNLCRAGIIYLQDTGVNPTPSPKKNEPSVPTQHSAVELKVYPFSGHGGAKMILTDVLPVLERGKEINAQKVLEVVRDISQRSPVEPAAVLGRFFRFRLNGLSD